MEIMGKVNMVDLEVRLGRSSKMNLTVVERVLLLDLFVPINSPMGLEKVEAREKAVANLELSDEEKKKIGYKEVVGPVKQVQFNQDKAAEIEKDCELCDWATDLIKTWLHYSILLDDFKPTHSSLHKKFC